MADGRLDTFGAKTAVGLLRYRPDNVVAVLDRQHAGGDLGDILSVGQGVPIVAGVADALSWQPTTLVIGVATAGGIVPPEWRPDVLAAIESGMEVVNGLHQRLGTDRTLADAAAKAGVGIYDIRHSDRTFEVGCGKARRTKARRVLTVGSDCNVGKMVAGLELTRALQRRGCDARFIATGQTGIMIQGSGVCVDAVLSDFVAGAVEGLVCEQGDADVVVVEGQGSILHAGFSSAAIGLMHGVMPDCMVLVHAAGRSRFRHTDMPIPPLGDMVRLYEAIMGPLHPSTVAAVALNCQGMNDVDTKRAIAQVERETHLPTIDCIRSGAEVLADAVMADVR